MFRSLTLLIATVVCLLDAATDAASTSAKAQRPNILFAISDDQSFPHAGAYGCDWVQTPAFDRVAREGILFTRCYTPNAKCSPSRACLLTGRNSWQLEAACNHWAVFPPEFTSYAEALASNGYHVGHTGKGWAPGICRTAKGKPRNLLVRAYSQRRAKPPAKGISSIDYAANFAAFLDDRPENEPFCFWYGAGEPHRGYEWRSGIEKGRKSVEQIDEVPDFWPDNETVRTDMLDYAFEVEHFDRHLGRMLKELEQRGLLQRTIVVATSDHGMPFPRAKGQAYEISNHVPLAVMWPAGITQGGRVVDDYVSFIDFTPTWLELAGITAEQAGMQPIAGRSLLPLFLSTKGGQIDPTRDHVLIGKERHDVGRPHDWGYPIRGIFEDGYLYIRNFEPNRWPGGNPETGYMNSDGGPTKTVILEERRNGKTDRHWELCFGKRPPEELYHVAEDPDCINNLAHDPKQAERLMSMKQRMLRELKAQGDRRIQGEPRYYESMPYGNARDRDFHRRYTAGKKEKAGWVTPSDYEEKTVEE